VQVGLCTLHWVFEYGSLVAEQVSLNLVLAFVLYENLVVPVVCFAVSFDNAGAGGG